MFLNLNNKTIFKKLSVTICALAISACSSTKNADVENGTAKQSAPQINSLPCVFPDMPKQAAPKWVCEEKVEGLTIQGMGMSEVKQGGLSHQRQLAIMDAQSILAQQLAAKVKGAIQNYISTKGLAASNQVIAETSELRQVILEKQIFGMNIYQSVRSEGGTYYVLAGLNKEAFDKNMEQVIVHQLPSHLSATVEADVKPELSLAQAKEKLARDIAAYASQ